jgi:hypothetical protein
MFKVLYIIKILFMFCLKIFIKILNIIENFQYLFKEKYIKIKLQKKLGNFLDRQQVLKQ